MADADTDTDPMAWHELGTALFRSGDLEQALSAYDAALRLRPDRAEGHRIRACVLLAQGRLDAAADGFGAARALSPDDVRPLLDLAFTRQCQGRNDEALALLDQALALDPAATGVRLRRARALSAAGRHAGAVADLDLVLAAEPGNLDALAERGGAHWHLMAFGAAARDLDRVLAADPGRVSSLVFRGNVLRDESAFAAALDCFDRALAAAPDYVPALINRGGTLQALQRPAEALAAYERALAADPGNAGVRMSLGMCQLLTGNWADGWRNFEARLDKPHVAKALAGFAAPRWDGRAPVAGKRLLLVGEEGLGDMIQFCRFAHLLAARGATVIVGVDPPLKRLLQGLPGAAEVVSTGDDPAYDLYCPIMSLPAIWQLASADLATGGPYLRADPADREVWRARLAGLPGIKVGLAWAGNPHPHDHIAARMDRRRSVALDRLAPVMAVPGISFVSLQKGSASAQAAGRPVFDRSADLRDFADTAALIMELDLVVSVDTAVVHAAGALGRPVWVLNRYDRCWRWMQDRTDSPWYPTVRLFTQPAPGDWDGLAQEVAAALSQFASFSVQAS